MSFDVFVPADLIVDAIAESTTVVDVFIHGPIVIDAAEVGIAGPAGPPGQSTAAFPYEWKTNILETNPAHGFVKANNVVATAYTAIYISVYDKDGRAFLPINNLMTGDDIYIYEAGQIATWNRYRLTGPVILQGTPTDWATIPVVFAESGPSPFTPGGNTQVLVLTEHMIAESTYIHVAPTPPSSPEVDDLWVDTT